MISRSWSAYSSMIRRASPERDSLGGSFLSTRLGSSDGFMSQRSDRPKGNHCAKSKGTNLPRGPIATPRTGHIRRSAG